MVTSKPGIKLRSRNGCLTCRDRHIKCDENLPVCNNCKKSNKTCKRGSRLNFLKSTVYDPKIPTNYETFKIVDQSFTIHKFYKFNKFHNFTNWFKYHSLEELFESDEEFERSLDFINDQLNKNQLRLVSIVELINESFNIKKFLNKLLVIQLPSIDHSLFTFVSLQRTLLLQSFNMELEFSEPKSIEKLTVKDFQKYCNFLDTLELKSERFETHYNILLNSLNLAMKLKKINVFEGDSQNDVFLNKLNMITTNEHLQNFDNLMYCFEIWLLDLNNSIYTNTAPYFSVIYDDRVEFLLSKILHLNLFNDLNYFLIKVLTTILKLNNVYNESSTHLSQNYELFLLIKDLKNFENNHFLSMCFPKIQDNQLKFANLKTRKFHIWYNFTIVYILTKFHVSSEMRKMLFTDTVLFTFWDSFEANPFKRLSFLITNYDYDNDPFMKFLKNYQIFDSDELLIDV
ncbi:hypothetical protein BN7_6257 [Wickerhamomyces ciferrii]|uniref:Zn(2)-C6 fungal-type domain-containing protein n=1 Tax=Wickerhamomyces ciferrii (strain ATCC 14091 / BCRC 22168 / CBS 111 / JCM 3599 / NBRC 0793 / NRRL Y-1031 F-60-10) TaxID=1206466 RepID=K0KU04_WICCF|nr:uncharacterized protein BN7_6257 [Wickerhamomyces ciferrii]CCH46661.1 hypothetical protein BN7_6257 [Wickerhamomyces ciferrii]